MLRSIELQIGYVWSIAAVAMVAAAMLLAVVLLLPGAQPAAAQGQETVFHHTATLKAKAQRGGFLGCAHHLDSPCHDAGNMSDNTFTYGGADREINWVLLDADGNFDFAVAPYQDADEVEGLTLRVGVETTVNGITTLEIRSFDLTSEVREGGNFKWTSTGMTWQTNANVYLAFITTRDFAELSFNGATIDNRTYTQGGEVSYQGLSEAAQDALRLPMAMGGGYTHTYAVAGLPPGLSMGYDRLIYGTPTAATASPATVTYTATDDNGGSVSLTFQVTVAPPVVFDAEERRAFEDTVFEYTVGQAAPINATLPAASGGHGTLTYGLSYWVKETRTVDGRQITGGVEKSIDDDAPGFSFDAATRTLTSDTGASAPSEAAFYSVDYWAEDENGARAVASNSITVNEAPTLPVTQRNYFSEMTVGESVSVTLPEAEGGTRVGIGIRYDLEDREGTDLSAVGLSFNGRTRTLSGTPVLNIELDMDYTATDRNGVTASRLYQVFILAGPLAPTAEPDLTAFNAATDSGRQIVFLDWADVERATGYVVQVIPDDGTAEFPNLALGVLPEEASLTVYDSRTDLGGGKTAHALITGLPAGDYLVSVTAKNVDGVGPWSSEVEFTVPVGGI